MKRQQYIFSILTLACVFALNTLSAQIKNAQVEVSRTYEGQVIDADPLDFRLSINDSLKILKNRMEYNNPVAPLETYVLERIIPPAGIVRHTPNQQEGFFYLRAGLGFPFTPQGDLYIHAPLPSSASLNFNFNHRSFFGNVPLFENRPARYTATDKIAGDYMNNDLGVSFRKTWTRNTLTIQGGYKGRSVLFHGNDTSLLLRDTSYAARLADNKFVKDNFSQTYNIITGEIRFRANQAEGFDYNIGVWANYIKDKAVQVYSLSPVTMSTPMSQTLLGADGYFGYWFTTVLAGYIDYDLRMFNKYNLSGFSDASIRITPNFRYATRAWDVKIGAGIDFLSESELISGFNARQMKPTKTKIYPDIYVSYKLDEDYAIAYFKMDGKTRQNNYSAIALENPYIVPGLSLDNTYDRLGITFGLHGNLGKAVNYNVFASHSTIDSMYFYTNSQILTTTATSANTIHNNFEVQYDSIVKRFTAGLDLSFILRNFSLNTRLQYYSYNMSNLEQAWHKPSLEAAVNGRYSATEKLIFSLNGYLRGAVPVLIDKSNPILPAQANARFETEIKSYFDLSFMTEYRIKDWISVYLQGSDLLNTRYQNYYLYYTQGITITGGLTLKF